MRRLEHTVCGSVTPATYAALRELAARTRVPASEFVRIGIEIAIARAHAQLEATGGIDWDAIRRATP